MKERERGVSLNEARNLCNSIKLSLNEIEMQWRKIIFKN